jgi:hypothetical protein
VDDQATPSAYPRSNEASLRREFGVKTSLIMAAAMLIAGSDLALHMAQAQQAGSKRTELQHHDLSAPGREVIQVVSNSTRRSRA